jgi:hypothetical protein
MSSGLLPKGDTTGNGSGGSGLFSDLTVDNLVVNATAVISNLIVSGSLTFGGIFKAALGVWSDVYSNYTPGSTVTVSTRSANANVLLSPDGTGGVVVKAASTLSADTLTATTANGPLTLAPNGSGSILATALVATAPTLVNVVAQTDGGTGRVYRFTLRGTWNTAASGVVYTFPVPNPAITQAITCTVEGNFHDTITNEVSYSLLTRTMLFVPATSFTTIYTAQNLWAHGAGAMWSQMAGDLATVAVRIFVQNNNTDLANYVLSVTILAYE